MAADADGRRGPAAADGRPRHRVAASPGPATWSTPRATLKNPAWLAEQGARAARRPAARHGHRAGPRTSCAAGGFGGVLAVGGGSATPPRVVVAGYRPPDARPRPPGPGRQGHHVRHRRHLDQAQRGHARDEDRHGRGSGRAGGRRRRRPAAAAGRGHRRGAGRGERRLRRRRTGRRTSSGTSAAAPPRCSTPTPRAGMVLADALGLRPARARRDRARRRRHADRRDEGRARARTAGCSPTTDGLADALRTAAVRAGRAAVADAAARGAPRPAGQRRSPTRTTPPATRGRSRRRCSCSRSPATCRGRTWTSPVRPARAPTTRELVKGGTGFGARTLLRWLEAGSTDRPHRSRGRLIRFERRAIAGGAVDRLAQQVGVAGVPGGLLDQVQHHPAQIEVLRRCPASAPTAGRGSSRRPTTSRLPRRRRRTGGATRRARRRRRCGTRSRGRRPSRRRPSGS